MRKLLFILPFLLLGCSDEVVVTTKTVTTNQSGDYKQPTTIYENGVVKIRHRNTIWSLNDWVRKATEQGYYSGQKDAIIDGRFRIEKVDDEDWDDSNDCYRWIESPWDGGELKNVKFEPNCH